MDRQRDGHRNTTPQHTSCKHSNVQQLVNVPLYAINLSLNNQTNCWVITSLTQLKKIAKTMTLKMWTSNILQRTSQTRSSSMLERRHSFIDTRNPRSLHAAHATSKYPSQLSVRQHRQQQLSCSSVMRQIKCRQTGRQADCCFTIGESKWNNKHAKLNVHRQVERNIAWKVTVTILKLKRYSMGSQWSR